MSPLDLASALLLCLLGLAAGAVSLHVVAWLHLLWLRTRSSSPDLPPPLVGDDLPSLTLQLPLYNEPAMARDLLHSVAALDWPRELLQVQVLDDSTDETPAIVAAELPDLRRTGLDIQHLRRGSRQGFKAGALAHGLQTAQGELIAVLDADFRPQPDWLRRAVACLRPDDGLVQCRWAFTNPGDSVLTRVQALHLDAHFALEQQARSAGDLLFGFNGTAGIWRRDCILAAGGWHADTLTEDLDLAYRAQLAGWRLRYVDAIAVPSLLPTTLPAVRAQQHRWIRGGAQVGRKLLLRLWRSSQPPRRKLQGTAHLLASSVFIPVLLLCLLAPLVPLVADHGPSWAQAGLALPALLLRAVFLVLLLAYGTVCVARCGALLPGLGRLLRDLPAFLVLVTAICVHDAHAAWLGWVGPTGTFVRTPKGTRPARTALPAALPAEALLALWSLVGLGLALYAQQWAVAPFLGLQALGFSGLVAATLWASRPAPAEPSWTADPAPR